MVTLHGIWDVKHHWAGRIDDVIAVAKVYPEPLPAERHGEIAPWFTSDGGLHPYHAASANISFQRRNSCRVRSDELIEERVVPVKNNYSILAEVEPNQFIRRKHLISMPGSGDGVFNEGRAPRIVRLEQREFLRRRLAHSKRVLNGIGS